MTAPLSRADLAARFRVLARLAPPASPVVSVYLDTDWAEEQQRERARAFLRNAIRKARAGAAPELEADLAWVEKRSAALIEQTWSPDTRAVALFACRCAGLREVLPLSVFVQDCFAVAATPHVGQLGAVLEAPPGTRRVHRRRLRSPRPRARRACRRGRRPRGRASGPPSEGTRTMIVEDVMQTSVTTITPKTPLTEAARLVRQRGIRHLPVVQDHALVGIVSDRDLKRAAAPSPEAPEVRSLAEVYRGRDHDPCGHHRRPHVPDRGGREPHVKER
jgi:CBS domain-containing protein